ncbi:MAG: DUF1338 domain-containing protein [Bacteroidales bacterium]|nr:DUF1338 domain-containing protein [Bacteroidales bacterium]
MQAQEIFDKLWAGYITQNPEAKKIHDSFVAEGEKVENDHIAFRTFYHPHINIDVLARPFLLAGFVQKGYYIFEDKHLTAKHFEHPTWPNAPRVFISQLMTEFFSPELQSVVKRCVEQIPESQLFENELVFAGNVWEKPSYSIYEMLRKESEYAAWLYVYGFRANHFTVSINHLQKLNTIEKVNQFLLDKGFLLNQSGGVIKGNPSELLEQSSTLAGIMTIDFVEGKYDIPSCYYEFARRYPDTDGKLYSGFIAKSADKIFESTDFYKK